MKSLEEGIDLLADRKTNAAIAKTQLADRQFEKVRQLFKKFEVRTGYRDFIVPQLTTNQPSKFGRPSFLKVRRKPLTRKEIDVILRLLLQTADGKLTSEPARIELAAMISAKQIQIKKSNRNPKHRGELDSLVEKALLMDGIIDRWSIALKAFNPAKGEYAEPVFKYD